ncbi:Prolyl tri/tetrapeptidyl aminopeptidase [Myxococcus stipitatus]
MKHSHRHTPSIAAWFLSAALLLQACGGTGLVETPDMGAPRHPTTSALTDEAEASEDLLTQLQAVPGLTVEGEINSPIPGTRFFQLALEQPADHRRPSGERFQLRLWLLHRSVTAPMVLFSTGYGDFPFPVQVEPTALLGANQIAVGHRFFGSARPASNNWRQLDIWQGANDLHRLVQALKPLYPQRWLTTGISKGGMTSVYHRYFFPHDVDATVAYVAPSSHGVDDARYVRFLHQVGDEACRARLRDLQVDVLRRREQLLPVLEQWAVAQGVTFHHLGLDRTLEITTTELPFSFWQYSGDWRCTEIPLPGAPLEEVFAFLDDIVPFATSFSDFAIAYFEPYYYQAATELGTYRLPTRHLRGLLRYPGQNTPATFVRFPITEDFDEDLMPRVEHWVRHQGNRMLFIYGENDPWSAGAFDVRERNDSFRFYVPGGNHNTAAITTLPEAQRARALERLYSWMGVSLPSAERHTRMNEATLAPTPLLEGRFRM